MTAFNMRVSDETASKLDQIAGKLDRSRYYMAAQAVEDYVAREEWQIAEIEAGLAEANRVNSLMTTRWLGSLENTFSLSQL